MNDPHPHAGSGSTRHGGSVHGESRDNTGLTPDESTAGELAPDSVQAEIAALLRSSAAQQDASLTMPGDVESRIRNALRAEAGASKAAPPTIIPLPQRSGSRTARAGSSTPDASRPQETAKSSFAADTADRHSAAPLRDQATTFATPKPSEKAAENVHSLSEHRNRRRFGKKGLAGAGAAAAVVIGLGVGGPAALTALNDPEPGQTQSTADETMFASRVTNSQRSYTKDALATQAASLPTNTSFPVVQDTPENRAKLGHLASKDNINKCIDLLNHYRAQDISKVFADFGTYQGQPAVVVVVQKKDSTQDVLVVNTTCQTASDELLAPQPLAT